MTKFENVQFNKDMVKKRGFDHFRANIHDLVKRGKIGERIEGKIVGPTEAAIRAKYTELTGLEVKPEKIKAE